MWILKLKGLSSIESNDAQWTVTVNCNSELERRDKAPFKRMATSFVCHINDPVRIHIK